MANDMADMFGKRSFEDAFEDHESIADPTADFEALQPIYDFLGAQANDDANVTLATNSFLEDMATTSGPYWSEEDMNFRSASYDEEVNLKSATNNLEQRMKQASTETAQTILPEALNKKKRKLSGEGSGKEPMNKAKKGKTSISSEQVASGFLESGRWVSNAKFACVSCRRGHRAATCKEGIKGKPVQLVEGAGRPAKGVTKVDTTCRCGPEQCRCRHPSYLLGPVMVDGVQKWKIVAFCVSDGKAHIVRCDAPCSTGYGGARPMAPGTY